MSDKGSVIHVSDGSFEQEVLQSDKPVLVDFWAPWCGPCKRIGPVLDELAEQYDGRLAIAKMNVDENTGVASQMGVRSIPMLVLFKEGKAVDSVVGALPRDEMERFLDKWV